MIAELINAFTGPLVLFSTSWADTMPDRIVKLLPMARMIALQKDEQLGTYEEVSLYLMSASLEIPLSHDWAQIYTHCAATMLEKWFNENAWDKTEAPRELNRQQSDMLNKLRLWIYKKRTENMKKDKEPIIEATPPKQLSLF